MAAAVAAMSAEALMQTSATLAPQHWVLQQADSVAEALLQSWLPEVAPLPTAGARAAAVVLLPAAACTGVAVWLGSAEQAGQRDARYLQLLLARTLGCPHSFGLPQVSGPSSPGLVLLPAPCHAMDPWCTSHMGC
jgi:hypothetical protein